MLKYLTSERSSAFNDQCQTTLRAFYGDENIENYQPLLIYHLAGCICACVCNKNKMICDFMHKLIQNNWPSTGTIEKY